MAAAEEEPVRLVTIPILESLYRQRYRQFLRVGRGILGDRELAHDAVQETFARAIKSRIEFRGEESVANWLWRTLVNVCLDERRTRRSLQSLDSTDSPPGSENGRPQQWPELRAAVAALPERQRLAIFLRHYADLDYDTIAAVLEVERGTVAATLHAAHSSLRHTLKEVRQ